MCVKCILVCLIKSAVTGALPFALVREWVAEWYVMHSLCYIVVSRYATALTFQLRLRSKTLP